MIGVESMVNTNRGNFKGSTEEPRFCRIGARRSTFSPKTSQSQEDEVSGSGSAAMATAGNRSIGTTQVTRPEAEMFKIPDKP